jgi:hypothetical protein
MKKINFLFISLFLLMGTTEVSAQRFLERLERGVNRVTQALESVANPTSDTTTEGNSKQSSTPNYEGTIITCSDPNLDIQLESCIRNGATGTVTITYLLKNNGQTLTISNLGQANLAGSEKKTGFYDNLGNSYQWREITLGNVNSGGGPSINSVTVPEGVSLRGTIEIPNVNRNAESFTLVTMAGWQPFFFSFKNLPIRTVENVRQVSAETSGINIPKTTGLLDEVDDKNIYWNRPAVSPAKRNSMQIDRIDNDELKLILQNGGKIAEGKTIYTGNEGRIETFLVIIPDHRIYEYLISYDAAGNYVDCIHISLWGYSDPVTSTIEGNTVLVQSEWWEDDEGGGTYKGYTITPELRFNQFKEESKMF